MPRALSKKKKAAETSAGSEARSRVNPLRRGMPSLDSITGVKEMTRGGKVYRIIKTTETDDYDQPLTKEKRKRRR